MRGVFTVGSVDTFLGMSSGSSQGSVLSSVKVINGIVILSDESRIISTTVTLPDGGV